MNVQSELFVCPECSSSQVTTTHEQIFMANTGDHYCHSVKTHDPESKSDCLDCGWQGKCSQLKFGMIKERT